MTKRKNVRKPSPSVCTLDLPVPSGERALEELLASKLGSKSAAEAVITEIGVELGIPAGGQRTVSAALALTKLGIDLDRISRSLEWAEFEDYCATAISAAGYGVKKNVRLRKPTRQIDIIAESGSLVLSIDCKQWRRGSGPASLHAAAAAQAERTRMYAKGSRAASATRFLPMLLTMVDNPTRTVGGIPVVPLQALREFLSAVNVFDERFAFIEAR